MKLNLLKSKKNSESKQGTNEIKINQIPSQTQTQHQVQTQSSNEENKVFSETTFKKPSPVIESRSHGILLIEL